MGIEIYLAIGLGMYVGMALNNPKGFVDANAAALIRGILLCWVLWPIGLITKLIMIMTDKDE